MIIEDKETFRTKTCKISKLMNANLNDSLVRHSTIEHLEEICKEHFVLKKFFVSFKF